MGTAATPAPVTPVPVSLSIDPPVVAMLTAGFNLGNTCIALAEKVFDAAPKDVQGQLSSDVLKVIHNATAPFIALGDWIDKKIGVQ